MQITPINPDPAIQTAVKNTYSALSPSQQAAVQAAVANVNGDPSQLTTLITSLQSLGFFSWQDVVGSYNSIPNVQVPGTNIFYGAGSNPTKIINVLYDLNVTPVSIQNGLQSIQNWNTLYDNIQPGVAVPTPADIVNRKKRSPIWDPTSGFLEYGAMPSTFVLTALGAEAVGPIDSPQSLQHLVEVDYVKTANDFIGGKLEQLQVFLTQTKSAIDIIADIQNLRNTSVIVHSNPPPHFDSTSEATFQSTAGSYFYSGVKLYAQDAYTVGNNVHSATAGVPGLAWGPGTSVSPGYIARYNQLRGTLSIVASHIASIAAASDPTSADDPNSLLALLQQVKAGMPVVTGHGNYASLSSWLIDGNNGGPVNLAGANEQNINKSLTAAETLNTAQVSDIRNSLLLFEEFYKSATAILQQITQIITRMAQAVSR